MSKNYEDDKVGLYPIAVPTPPAEDEYWSDKATSDFVTAPTENDMEMATAITTTAAYIAKFDNVSILTLGKVSDLANDESYKNSKITFNQGTAVENLIQRLHTMFSRQKTTKPFLVNTMLQVMLYQHLLLIIFLLLNGA